MNFSKDWIRTQWRPLMAMVYMITCLTDFVIFPVLWALIQTYIGTGQVLPWDPLTLQGAGLYHIAMGAVLGVTAWSRGQEKISAINKPHDYKPHD